jgi:thioredoxin 1
MLKRLIAFTLALFSFCAVSVAGELRAYDKDAFDAAMKAGQPVIVHVHADWCSVCLKQQPILANFVKDGSLKDGTLFTVNYDQDRDFLKTFNVRTQSTIIIFKQGKENGRIVGKTDADFIRKQIAEAF